MKNRFEKEKCVEKPHLKFPAGLKQDTKTDVVKIKKQESYVGENDA